MASLVATASVWVSIALSGSGQVNAPLLRVQAPPDVAGSGERLYIQGLSADGSALTAIVQGDLRVRSTEMPCVNCHRRSGMGTAEGPIRVPALVGSLLFSPVTAGAPQLGTPRTTGAGTRPPYTDAALFRALRDGVDPSGRELSPTMPRYTLSESDAASLGAYFRSLGAETPPGVTDSTIHLATIVTPRVSAARRSSMLDVFRTYVRSKNGGTRYETRRRERGGWDMKQQYQVYRDWVLEEWELHGAPGEWPAQLEELYRRQPVFAIVGGIADEDWSPIDAFSARHGIPAILPQTPLPPAVPSSDGFYSLYFSKGVTLEAQTLAHHLDTSASVRRVRQFSRCGAPGQVAATALSATVTVAAVRSECLDQSIPLTTAIWHKLLDDCDTLILWLDRADMAGLDTLAAEPASLARVAEIYLSSSLLGEDALRVPAPLASRASLVHPFVAPDQFDLHAARSLMWMKANGIKPVDRQVAVNALFAIILAGDALNVPGTLHSREYFVERLEHMTSRSLNPTAFPSVTFDARRRFASSGSYVLKMPSSPGESFRKVEPWHVPKS